MIEITVLNYLLSKNLSVGNDVYAEVPKDPPDKYIIIEKTGSSRTNRIDQAMIAIQSYSKNSLLEAMELNEEIKQAMAEMPQMDDIFSCKLNSDYNFTSTSTKEYRSQAVFNMFY